MVSPSWIWDGLMEMETAEAPGTRQQRRENYEAQHVERIFSHRIIPSPRYLKVTDTEICKRQTHEELQMVETPRKKMVFQGFLV